MTPTRHRSQSAHHYLPAVNVSVPFSKYDCTQNTIDIQAGSSGGVLVCLVTFGPSLSLVNYIGTIFAARAVFVDGSRTPWSYFDGFGFPTQSMTVLNVRSVSLPADGLQRRGSAVETHTHTRTHNTHNTHFLKVSFSGGSYLARPSHTLPGASGGAVSRKRHMARAGRNTTSQSSCGETPTAATRRRLPIFSGTSQS